jgi:hypothetical protein
MSSVLARGRKGSSAVNDMKTVLTMQNYKTHPCKAQGRQHSRPFLEGWYIIKAVIIYEADASNYIIHIRKKERS